MRSGLNLLNDPEFQERTLRFRAQEREFRAMTDAELAERAQHTLDNSAIPFSRYIRRGELVYDSVLWNVVIPELIRRTRERA